MEFESQDIGEQIISKLKELNAVLDDLIKRCRGEKNGRDE